MSEENSRAQKLGELIQEARQYADRSTEDCAAVLQVSPERFSEMEAGDHPVSLPDLEALALYLRVPMGFFWGTQPLVEKPHVDYMNVVALRHKVMGVQLQQQRMAEKKTVKDLAEAIDVPVAVIEAYEAGETPIPYLQLERLSQLLNVSVDYFVDTERGPLGRHEAELALLRQYGELSPEVQDFIVSRHSAIYLETARRLSEMDVARLRQIAESILEITW